MPFLPKRPIHPSSATPGEAIQYLASTCDGAIKRDGLGFSSDDVAWGHHLANGNEATWTPAERQEALRQIRVYQRQLANAGYNPLTILRGRTRTKCSRRTYRKLVAGWFPDPTRFDVWRYWNGARWTHHTTAVLNNERELVT